MPDSSFPGALRLCCKASLNAAASIPVGIAMSPIPVMAVNPAKTDEIAPNVTRFAHETRAVATDTAARKKFLRYWRWARFGIITIRGLLMPAIRRPAERQWASQLRDS
jgi:hypothetical protein